MSNYQRKTRDEYSVQQWTSYGGWEEVCTEDTRSEARAREREYRDNMPEFPVRIVKQRVKIGALEVA